MRVTYTLGDNRLIDKRLKKEMSVYFMLVLSGAVTVAILVAGLEETSVTRIGLVTWHTSLKVGALCRRSSPVNLSTFPK